jgi:ribosomal protein S18 acetylase RimI-like enzyme
MTNIIIRPFSFQTDFTQVLDLWQSAGQGIHVQRSDQPAEILKKLDRDPDLFMIACDGERIIGSVIGGFDGRRGMIYHLAVANGYRNQGIASRLMEEVENKLRALGCIRCYLFVTPDNHVAKQFYENRGWKPMKIIPFAKDLSE